MRIGVLSTVNSPVLTQTIVALHRAGFYDLVLLLDKKVESAKDLQIWRARTEDYFETLPNTPATIYEFGRATPPAYFVKSHNAPECIELIRTLQIGVMVNGFTPRKLTQEVLDASPNGVINVHPGILPKYRGCTCVEWAIYNNDQVGNTGHLMTKEYDEGPILFTEGYEFPKDADYRLIRSLTYQYGFDLLGRCVKAIKEGSKPGPYGDQKLGQYWSPIPDDKMAKVLRIIANRSYPYMCL